MIRFFAQVSITSRITEFCDLSGSSAITCRITEIVTSVSNALTSFVPLSLIGNQLLGLFRRDLVQTNSSAYDFVLLTNRQSFWPESHSRS